MDEQQIKFLLSLPPEEIVSWYKSKGLTVTWSWRDLWQEAHSRSFTVAKAMKLDILQSIKDEVDKIFESGITYEQFKKDLEPILKRLGWWGKVKAGDVPGFDAGHSRGIDPESIVQLGSPSRLKTIFRVNSSVGYNSLRYKNQWANRESRPYWWYIQLDRPTKRKAHEHYHNKVFLATDPIWDKIYPPNGWFCMCMVRALTKEEFEARKLKLYDGTTMQIITDEGWDYNPGKTAMWDKYGNLPPCSPSVNFSSEDGKRCIKIISEKTWRDFGRIDIRKLNDEYFHDAPLLLEPGKSFNEALGILKKSLGLTETNKIVTVQTPIEQVIIKEELLPHMVEKRFDQRERYANYIIPTLENPFEIYATKYEDDKVRLQYIGLFKGRYNLLTIVRMNPDGSLNMYNFMHSDNKDMNSHRKGEFLLWPHK